MLIECNYKVDIIIDVRNIEGLEFNGNSIECFFRVFFLILKIYLLFYNSL